MTLRNLGTVWSVLQGHQVLALHMTLPLVIESLISAIKQNVCLNAYPDSAPDSMTQVNRQPKTGS